MKISQSGMMLAWVTFTEIKAAVEDFDKGKSNLFDALDRIHAAISTSQTAGQSNQEAA
jgi:hypothetical protein